jgi:hypothetical protein
MRSERVSSQVFDRHKAELWRERICRDVRQLGRVGSSLRDDHGSTARVQRLAPRPVRLGGFKLNWTIGATRPGRIRATHNPFSIAGWPTQNPASEAEGSLILRRTTCNTSRAMDVMSVRVDPDTKRRMGRLADVNWAEVIRETLRERLESEEDLRKPLDRRRARRGARGIDAIRRSLRPTSFDSTREVRKWRESRK